MFFDKLKEKLNKTKQSFDERINNVVKNFRKVDEELLEELEEILIMSDIGVETSIKIISNLREEAKKQNIKDGEELKELLKQEMEKVFDEVDSHLKLSSDLSVILVIGVNGVGKTTSIGKIANNLKKQGKKVLLVAADTFRAAAVEQLEIWADRAGVDLVKKEEGSDPASVVFDGIKKAKQENYDVLVIDTAGRLHNRKELMDELAKINRIIDKELENYTKETLLVLDGTTGQNAINQTKLFTETAKVTGIVLTKMDGTAKGGFVLGIVSELKIPVKYIGIGEQIDDMEPFNPQQFVSAII
ncbi:MAG: signal recognition particle-docking protein FtsY [Clostridiales bacterium]|nr:signal recognition particle-docking protein FtsY [Clostridiales bacterium]